MTTAVLKTTLLNYTVSDEEVVGYSASVKKLHQHLHTVDDLTGWLTYVQTTEKQVFQTIDTIADEIKECADVLVVIGVGGSFLGARAIQDALTPYFGRCTQGIEVVYVGQNMSGAYIKQLLAHLNNKRVYVNVISKSGGTMEPALAFRVIRQYMEERYGLEAARRIIATTDAEKGILKQLSDDSGYRQFVIPNNIGGRYSVITPVGLLPLAVAGVNISEFLAGVKTAATELNNGDLTTNDAYKYAVIRHILYTKGYNVELLVSFEPSLRNFHEWWRQLFGESEGKEKKGLYPSAASFTTDLHSIGQFIQEGSPILFETLIHFRSIENDFEVPFDYRDEDQLNYLAGRSFNEINRISKQGTTLAHSEEGGVPVVQLELMKLDAFNLGYLIFFFMKACAMSAYLLEVNPFDQPGVEAYKKKMLELLQVEKVTN